MLRKLARAVVPQRYLPTAVMERHLQSLTEGGTRVVNGPFEGLRLRSESYFSPIYNKLLGAYERELHHVVEQVIALSPSLVVDIGAAEGYYACGLAKRCGEHTRHIAFESDFRSRFVLRRNLEANNLGGRVLVSEQCSAAELQRVIQPATGQVFVLCDVEGMEAELLDPALVPGLVQAHILVELHEFAIPGVGDFLKQRHATTHVIEEIVSEPRSVKDLIGDTPVSWLRWLPQSTIARFADERPSNQSWLFMRPKLPSSSED
jgi:hypothetical protein